MLPHLFGPLLFGSHLETRKSPAIPGAGAAGKPKRPAPSALLDGDKDNRAIAARKAMPPAVTKSIQHVSAPPKDPPPPLVLPAAPQDHPPAPDPALVLKNKLMLAKSDWEKNNQAKAALAQANAKTSSGNLDLSAFDPELAQTGQWILNNSEALNRRHRDPDSRVRITCRGPAVSGTLTIKEKHTWGGSLLHDIKSLFGTRKEVHETGKNLLDFLRKQEALPFIDQSLKDLIGTTIDRVGARVAAKEEILTSDLQEVFSALNVVYSKKIELTLHGGKMPVTSAPVAKDDGVPVELSKPAYLGKFVAPIQIRQLAASLHSLAPDDKVEFVDLKATHFGQTRNQSSSSKATHRCLTKFLRAAREFPFLSPDTVKEIDKALARLRQSEPITAAELRASFDALLRDCERQAVRNAIKAS